MFSWFKKNPKVLPEKPLAAAWTAPGTTIQYSADLIIQFTQEHRKLVELFNEVKDAFERGDYKKTVLKLNEFRSLFQGHMLTENVRLYIYLERSFADDEVNYGLIKGLRREMDGISRATLAFLEKYEALGVDKDVEERFADDLDAVGGILQRRIKTEETTLYPLYMRQY